MSIADKLEKVIGQAEEIGIPISKKIEKVVVINKRAKTRFGCCKKYKNGYRIEVSEDIVNGPEASLLQTLAHEVLHTCPNCQNHRSLWKAYAKAMNEAYGYEIKRTSTSEELGIAKNDEGKERALVKYRLICKGCGQIIERRRKSKLVTHAQLYRCKCGGKIERQI